MPQWWKENAHQVAHAIDDAEKSSGHQILVRVGSLGRHPDRVANKIATRYKEASLVFCVDPRHRVFEVRWSPSLSLDGAVATAAVQEHLRAHDLPSAITALAALLPRQEEGTELPDIIDDTTL
jgi:hypothetical protein